MLAVKNNHKGSIKKMANERITENLVRDILKTLKYYDNQETQIEEQKSQIEEVKKLLKGASKNR